MPRPNPHPGWKLIRFLWAPYGEIYLPAEECNILYHAGLVERVGWA